MQPSTRRAAGQLPGSRSTHGSAGSPPFFIARGPSAAWNRGMSKPRVRLDAEDSLLFGPSEASKRLRVQIERVAGTARTTVLLESPVAREAALAARAIHAISTRSSAQSAFLSIPCTRFSAGARTRPSIEHLLEQAPGGTLFLGEVAHLDPRAQDELLLALERSPVGVQSPLPRVIASTSRDLEAQVEAGEFREELLYRLNVLKIRVPSLAERTDDLDDLVPRILERIGRDLGLSLTAAPALTAPFKGYGWPGGLLELEGILTSAASRALSAAPPSTQVAAEHIPSTFP
ncbi:MAG TPA: hypothetical protein ENJ09_11080, partial [Planctomycetes bacterium]|nr:hypothetical protein [Planctomycetota bacterium]